MRVGYAPRAERVKRTVNQSAGAEPEGAKTSPGPSKVGERQDIARGSVRAMQRIEAHVTDHRRLGEPQTI